MQAIGDPIEAIGTNSTNPEHLLFQEAVAINPQIAKLQELMQQLTPEQIDQIYSIYGELKSQIDIAAEAGVTKAAINNRKSKLIARLKKLFVESDKQ